MLYFVESSFGGGSFSKKLHIPNKVTFEKGCFPVVNSIYLINIL